MVTANTVYAIYAISTIVDYFLLICERELEVYSVDGKPDYDDAGNELEDKSSYVYGKFLELSNFNTKHHEYRITKKVIATHAEEIFYPQVQTLLSNGKNIRIANDIILQLQVNSSWHIKLNKNGVFILLFCYIYDM